MSSVEGIPLEGETIDMLTTDGIAIGEETNKDLPSSSNDLPKDEPKADSLHNEDKQANQQTELINETRLLRDTLDLLWNQTMEQRNLCQQLEQENEYLQEYISNLMTSSNVLDK